MKSNLTVEGLLDLKGGLTIEGLVDLKSNLIVEGLADLKSNLTVEGPVDLKSDLTIEGAVNSGRGLDVHGSHIAFLSTVNPTYSVTLGFVSPGHHDSDSIYGYPNLWLDTAGTVFIKNNFQTPAMDGAEHFPYSEPVEPGDVVVLSAEGGRHVKPAENAYDTSVVGVASTDPGFILGGPASANEIEAVQQNNVPVALIGTVSCKVDADIASIHIGDLLTTSPTKGYAQKVLDTSKATGAVLGKAMGNLENGKGVVSILMMMC